MIHPTAIISEDAEIGADVTIHAFSQVMAGAMIHDHVMIGHGVFIGENVRIGVGCKIQGNCYIPSGVTIEEDVFIGPSVVFTNVKNPRANKIGDRSKTKIKHGVTIGANATIVCGIDILPDSFIAAGAVVAGNVLCNALMAGVPAKRIGWVTKEGKRE